MHVFTVLLAVVHPRTTRSALSPLVRGAANTSGTPAALATASSHRAAAADRICGGALALHAAFLSFSAAAELCVGLLLNCPCAGTAVQL